MGKNDGVKTVSADKLPMISASFLVLGNVLGVGVLALPVKTGLSGFVPALCGILLVWTMMLVSAWIIAYRIGNRKHFDIPSFYHQEIGSIGKWLAIACNLILLYGVLVAYLSGISKIIVNIFNIPIPQGVIVVFYFVLVTSLVMFGMGILRKGNMLVILGIWVTFAIMVFTGIKDFNHKLLFNTYDWEFVPLGLPVVVSAFHFHNIIPTVCRAMRHDQKATRKAIFIGVFLGLIINLVWVVIVLGTLPESNLGVDNIYTANTQNWPANIPMSDMLHSETFKFAGLLFALLAVTASYMANGTGLFGFVRDLTHVYFKTSNKALAGALAFIPPLVIALIYPDIFLVALTIVGGIGETILFAVLPGFILIRLSWRKSKSLTTVGVLMFLLGSFITIFVLCQQTGITNLKPPQGTHVKAEKGI